MFKKLKNKFSSKETKRNFRYLDELIQHSSGEIVLDSDIILDEGEEFLFKEGIEIKENSTAIDGNGFSIDAKNKVKIFKIENRFTLKNLTLKNSVGAIENSGNLTIINTNFKNNSREYEGDESTIANSNMIGGGAILNNYNKKLEIISSHFENNSASSGGAIENNGIITLSKSKFENNNCKFWGGAIYNHHTIDIDGTIFNNNDGKDGGGICNFYKTNIKNCEFNNNHANKGGSIENRKELIISKTTFKNNSSDMDGGAIYNWYNEGSLNAENCCFIMNNACNDGDSIYNYEGDIKFSLCKFYDHTCDNNLILNKDSMNISNSTFKNNKVNSIIKNLDESNLTIISGEFKNNNAITSTIYNAGRYCSINGTKFEDNNSQIEYGDNIFNETDLTLRMLQIKNPGKNIINKGTLLIKESVEGFENYVYNDGELKGVKPTEDYNFTYLNDLIHNADSKNITLDQDIILQEYERDFFEGGIVLDIDDLTIDGNGKTISGYKLSRIFIITAKNITLRNILFKDGFVHRNYDNQLNGGGAIQVNSVSDVKIENCMFIDNVSEKDGGAILNFGELTIFKTKFNGNSSNEVGGAINHYKNSLKIKNTQFENNKSVNGGAINSFSELTVEDSSFISNCSKYRGGALTLRPSRYEDGFARISKIKFLNNKSNGEGGAIHIFSFVTLEGNNLVFEKNSSGDGGAISAKNEGSNGHIDINLRSVNFLSNEVSANGGSIYLSDSNLKVIDGKFNNNSAGLGGGAIFLTHSSYNGNIGRIIVENSTFSNNKAKEFNDIYSNKEELSLNNCDFQ